MLIIAARSADAQQEQAAPVLNPLHALNKSALEGFRKRPLFDPSRTEAPTAPNVEAALPATEEPPRVQLVGVVTGETNLAIVRLDNARATRFLVTGDRLGAWSVTVLPAGLRLVSGERSVDVDLFAPKPPVLPEEPPIPPNPTP